MFGLRSLGVFDDSALEPFWVADNKNSEFGGSEAACRAEAFLTASEREACAKGTAAAVCDRGGGEGSTEGEEDERASRELDARPECDGTAMVARLPDRGCCLLSEGGMMQMPELRESVSQMVAALFRFANGVGRVPDGRLVLELYTARSNDELANAMVAVCASIGCDFVAICAEEEAKEQQLRLVEGQAAEETDDDLWDIDGFSQMGYEDFAAERVVVAEAAERARGTAATLVQTAARQWLASRKWRRLATRRQQLLRVAELATAEAAAHFLRRSAAVCVQKVVRRWIALRERLLLHGLRRARREACIQQALFEAAGHSSRLVQAAARDARVRLRTVREITVLVEAVRLIQRVGRGAMARRQRRSVQEAAREERKRAARERLAHREAEERERRAACNLRRQRAAKGALSTSVEEPATMSSKLGRRQRSRVDAAARVLQAAIRRLIRASARRQRLRVEAAAVLLQAAVRRMQSRCAFWRLAALALLGATWRRWHRMRHMRLVAQATRKAAQERKAVRQAVLRQEEAKRMEVGARAAMRVAAVEKARLRAEEAKRAMAGAAAKLQRARMRTRPTQTDGEPMQRQRMADRAMQTQLLQVEAAVQVEPPPRKVLVVELWDVEVQTEEALDAAFAAHEWVTGSFESMHDAQAWVAAAFAAAGMGTDEVCEEPCEEPSGQLVGAQSVGTDTEVDLLWERGLMVRGSGGRQRKLQRQRRQRLEEAQQAAEATLSQQLGAGWKARVESNLAASRRLHKEDEG